MYNKIQHFVIILTSIFLFSCSNKSDSLSKISGERLSVSENLESEDSIITYIRPYKEHIEKTLNEPLAYNPKTLSKSDGDLNTAIGNLMADIVMEMSQPIFNTRTGKDIDFVLLNHGGIRSVMSKGNVTAGTAYQVMPFENKVVVVELTYEKVLEMLDYLSNRQKADPVSGIEIILNKDNTLNKVLIQDKPLDEDRTYYVATSDYLADLGDNMYFFSNPVSITDLDYLIRNEMIDYFKKVDTLNPVIDNRFIKLQ